ncbi:Tetraspanin-9 [Ameca splendens]|uniref:Tetraspanin-9 n=1 Tax=Ameca splendens TaxID=208324 RepID=A0ABV0ZBZ0_9TELE
MVTGFLGCLGAIKENKCLLLSFFIVLLIILLAELILLILFFVYSDKLVLMPQGGCQEPDGNTEGAAGVSNKFWLCSTYASSLLYIPGLD